MINRGITKINCPPTQRGRIFTSDIVEDKCIAYGKDALENDMKSFYRKDTSYRTKAKNNTKQ